MHWDEAPASEEAGVAWQTLCFPCWVWQGCLMRKPYQGI